MRTREDIIGDMARTLTVTTVADGADEGLIEDSYSPGPGGDWMDTVEGIDTEAWKHCVALADRIEAKVGRTLVDMEAEWMPHSRRPDAFGHCLIMQSLGHGVGLSDDTYPVGLRLPCQEQLRGFHTEFHAFDLNPEQWPIKVDSDS
jgi:hypothetical protein